MANFVHIIKWTMLLLQSSFFLITQYVLYERYMCMETSVVGVATQNLMIYMSKTWICRHITYECIINKKKKWFLKFWNIISYIWFSYSLIYLIRKKLNYLRINEFLKKCTVFGIAYTVCTL